MTHLVATLVRVTMGFGTVGLVRVGWEVIFFLEIKLVRVVKFVCVCWLYHIMWAFTPLFSGRHELFFKIFHVFFCFRNIKKKKNEMKWWFLLLDLAIAMNFVNLWHISDILNICIRFSILFSFFSIHFVILKLMMIS